MAKKFLKRRRPKIIVPKECYFCKPTIDTLRGKGRIEPSFWDTAVLQRFLTERGKITPSARNGLCSKHQRVLSRDIKYARHLALLPFVARG